MITGVIECMRYNVAWQLCEICRHRHKARDLRLQAGLPYTGARRAICHDCRPTIYRHMHDCRHRRAICHARRTTIAGARRVAVWQKTTGAELAGIPLATQSPSPEIKESASPSLGHHPDVQMLLPPIREATPPNTPFCDLPCVFDRLVQFGYDVCGRGGASR